MVPYLFASYVAAAFAFYRHIYKNAPIIEEAEHECKIYELFPAEEEIRRVA